MLKDNKIYLKIALAVLGSVYYVTNLIVLFVVAKKTNNKRLMMWGWICLAVTLIAIFVAMTTSSSGLLSVCAICVVAGIAAPSVLNFINLLAYKNACELELTLQRRGIQVPALAPVGDDAVKNIGWVTPNLLKIAKQMYAQNGVAALKAIDDQMNYVRRCEAQNAAEMQRRAAQEQEAQRQRALAAQEQNRQALARAEEERIEKERRALELEQLKAQQQKAKAAAEAEALQMQRAKEEAELELAKIKAEKEKIEAETRALEQKNAAAEQTEIVRKETLSERYVFISYSTKDSEIAEQTKKILETSGIRCWIAPWSITAGSDYAAEIPKALMGCSAMVLLLSKSSQESKWVPKEVGLAIENNKIIIPFQIDNEDITDSFNFYLTNSQRIAAFNRMNEAYDELTKSLYRLLQID